MERLSHQLNLQLKGIFVPGLDDYLDSNGFRMYREFRLQLCGAGEALDPVSMKLTVRPAAVTPYSFQNEELLYEEQPLSFPNTHIYRVPIPLEEDAWHLKGYTFPFRGSRNPYRELRINPRISGSCPGRCIFCHRTHSHRLHPEQKHFPKPADLLEQVRCSEGEDVFARVAQVMLISELFGNEDRFLASVQDTREALLRAGFAADREFNCCATDVRSLDGLKRLSEVVGLMRFSFSLEFFQNREEWMGAYKGIPMKQVFTILENARRVGFEEIQLNYMAGMDGLEACQQGFSALSRAGLVDSVGLSTFVVFAEDEFALRRPEAWREEYYQELVCVLNDCHIKAYRPDSYDMVCPHTYLMEKTQ